MHCTSDNNGSRASVDTTVPSEDPMSASSEGKLNRDENYHLQGDKKMKAGFHVPCMSDYRQHRGKPKSSQRGRKREASSTFMDNNLNFTDTILMGLDSIDADLKGPYDIINLFNFDK